VEIIRRSGTCQLAKLFSFGGGKLVLLSGWQGEKDQGQLFWATSQDNGNTWAEPQLLCTGVDFKLVSTCRYNDWLAVVFKAEDSSKAWLGAASLKADGTALICSDGLATLEYPYVKGLQAGLDSDRLWVVWAIGDKVSVARSTLDSLAFKTSTIKFKGSIGHLTGLSLCPPSMAVIWGEGGYDAADLYLSHCPTDHSLGRTYELAHDNSDYAFRVPHRVAACDGALVAAWTLKGRKGFNLSVAQTQDGGATLKKSTLASGLSLRGWKQVVWSTDRQQCYLVVASMDDPSGLEVFRSLDRGRSFEKLPSVDNEYSGSSGASHLAAAFANRLYVTLVDKKSLNVYLWVDGYPEKTRSLTLPADVKKYELRCISAGEEGLLAIATGSRGDQGVFFLESIG
jgi:hypothetical protein